MSPIGTMLESINRDFHWVVVNNAINAFVSMVLVVNDENEAGIHEWVIRTMTKMSPDERFRHKLVTNGLYFAVIPQTNVSDFEAYIDLLDATPPFKFREQLLSGYDYVFSHYKNDLSDQTKPDWNHALLSSQNYIAQLIEIFGEDKADVEIETKAYEYVIDPAALKQLVVSHIRWFWTTHLKVEWERVLPMLTESANAFNSLDLSGMKQEELFRFITGKENNDSKWINFIEPAKNLYFLPNPHIGPYVRTAIVNEAAYVVFGAHLPEGSSIHIPELDRAEIVSKLSALADHTRLTILRLLAERGEMRSTEIMDEVKLSQPSVSRYLAQLTANGYLNEKRVNSAKVYSLNSDRIEKTLQAVASYLSVKRI